jgi:hypothetical protein
MYISSSLRFMKMVRSSTKGHVRIIAAQAIEPSSRLPM